MTESEPPLLTLRLTRLAYDDLAAALSQVENPTAKQRLVVQMRAALLRIAKFPLSGRIVPERRSGGYREVFVKPYRVVYAVAGDELHVLRVLHHRRDLFQTAFTAGPEVQ